MPQLLKHLDFESEIHCEEHVGGFGMLFSVLGHGQHQLREGTAMKKLKR
jgi:hypothetical protein